MIKALASSTGREPDAVFGKPNPQMLHVIMEALKSEPGYENINKTRICMVGDRLDTDIVFGNQGGLKTLLVYTGVTRPETVQLARTDNETMVPQFTITSLANLN